MYHAAGILQPSLSNPYEEGSLESLLFQKSWIDAVQWHLEDEVRSPDITADEGWAIKKKIDEYNQRRTDTVEVIDQYIYNKLKGIKHKAGTAMNSETPGWILDRLSILSLKIFHMKEEVHRKDAGRKHVENSHIKLNVLMEQIEDLGTALDELLADLMDGIKKMKVYYQMKMYNDEHLNPVLYRKKKP